MSIKTLQGLEEILSWYCALPDERKMQTLIKIFLIILQRNKALILNEKQNKTGGGPCLAHGP